MSNSQARVAATRIKASMLLQPDVQAGENKRKGEMTFEVFVTDHLNPYLMPRKRSFKRDLQLMARILPVFGAKRLSAITRQELQSFHAGLVEEGLSEATADLHLRAIKAAYFKTIEWNFMSGPNPASRLKLFSPDNRRREALTQVQLENLMKVLHEETSPVAKCVLLLLLTGCRDAEIRSLKYSTVDFEQRVIRIEATNSKSKRMREVPINDICMEVINQLNTRGKYDYLIINPLTGKPYVNITKSWRRIRKKAGIPDFWLHSLRRSFASLLASNNVPTVVISQLLGHASISTTQRYLVVQSDALRNATNSAGAIVQEAMMKAAA